MKITHLKIKNMYGIKEYEKSDGKNILLTGKNGVGKSALLDAIKLALTNKSNREYIIRDGETEAEVLIETDTGLRVHRKFRTNKADYKSIKQDGDKSEKPESFLREFFTELQLNPIEFAKMTVEEQNRIILDLIDFKWDINWIQKQFGEIPPQINYEQNILCVLHDIQHKESYYFKRREDVNREIRLNKGFIEEIGLSLPNGYNANHWVDYSLANLYKEIETIRHKNEQIENAKAIVKNRDNKVRRFVADMEIEKNAIERETASTRTSLEKQIADMENKIKLLKKDLSVLEQNKIDKITIAQKTYEANVAQLEGEVKEHETTAKQDAVDFSELQAEAENVEKMKAFVNEYNRMVELQSAVEWLIKESDNLTTKIEKARTLPGEILATSKVPIDGLTIKEGLPLINGLPISNLSEGEKFELCISVATRNSNALNMLLIDGIESLATDKRDKVLAKLKKKGVQFIATQTTDEEDLTVIQL